MANPSRLISPLELYPNGKVSQRVNLTVLDPKTQAI